jgi:hypothetical protein
LTDKLKKI